MQCELVNLGFKVIDLSLKGKSKSETKAILDQVDVIFVGGGNTFYLLDEANKSGFTELAPKYVNYGVIYVGGNAGSYIACHTIEAAGWLDSDENVVNITNLTAMNLVPYILKAHYEPGESQALKAIIQNCNYPVKILTDKQALLAIDNNYQIAGEGGEIVL